MSIMQGDPLPDITITRTTDQQAPEYYTDYLASLSEASKGPLSKTGAELIAGYDPLQDLGYGQYEEAAGAYMPGLTSAQQLAGQATGVTPQRIAQFMDPYQQSVIDEMARLSAQNVQRNVLPQLKAGFVGSGGLGGQRYAGALSQGLADIQMGLQGQQAQYLSKGYQDAVRAAFDQLAAERESAALQADLGRLGQELGITGAEKLTKAGAERQAYEQSIIDAPLKTAVTANQLLRGYQIPMITKETEVGPKAPYYTKSDFENLTGILALVGAINTQNQPGQQPTQSNQSRTQSLATQGFDRALDYVMRNLPSSSYPYGGADLDVGNVS